MSSYLTGLRGFNRTPEQIRQEAETAIDLADRPQQALTGALVEGIEGARKGLLGQERYEGLDAIVEAYGNEVPDNIAYDAASLAYDLFADPTNLIGGAIVKGLSTIDDVALKSKGMLTGSSPNVISDFYSLSPDKAFPTGYNPSRVQKELKEGKEIPKQAKNAYDAWSRTNTALHIVDKIGTSVDKLPQSVQGKIEAVVNKMPSKLRNTIAELQASRDPEVKAQADKMLGAYFKGQGFAQWAGKSAANVLGEVFDRTSQAMYKDTGLTKSNQQRVSKFFDRADNVGNKTALAQLQHAAYMAYRRGRKDLPPVLQETVDQMSIGGFQKMDPDKYTELSSTVEKNIRGQAYQTPQEVTKSLFRQAGENWGIPKVNDVTMVVRQPRGFSGDFVSDANRKSKAVMTGRRIFKENPNGFSKPSELKKAFEAKGFKNVKVVPNGVIITGSAASNSYLEGGVNVVTHIDTKGVGNVVISDQYDFLEKVPVVKKIESSMKEEVWGVTPPITVDLLGDSAPAVNKRTKAEDIGKLREMTKASTASTATLEKDLMKEGMLGVMTAREIQDED
jgi:hypothetical protein